MAKLAIKGHKTRGKEVIEILKMLGGITYENLSGVQFLDAYYITDDKRVEWKDYQTFKDSLIFSIEAFEKKYPHKVGDKVCFPDDLSTPFTINKMWWDENANELLCSFIEDDIEVPVVGVRAYKGESTDKTNKVVFDTNAQSCDIMNDIIKEEDMEEKENLVVVNNEHKQLKVHSLRYDKVQLMIDDKYELKQEGDVYYIVKKQPQYPKTYEECCKAIGCDSKIVLGAMPIRYNILVKLEKLLICRDAYWKIAGEEMGLGKPWEPDYLNPTKETLYFFFCTGDTIENGQALFPTNKIFIFPTEEMRDAYKENFNDDIEACKKFL